MKRDVLLYCIEKITGNNLKHFTNIELKDWVKDYLKLKKSNQNFDKNKIENKMEKLSLPPIHFYTDDDTNGYLSNYYGRHNARDFVLNINGVNWPSVEHYFQAAKFASADDAASVAYVSLISKAKTPNIAKILAVQKIGGGYAWRTALNAPIAASIAAGVKLRPDWDVYRNTVMEQAVTAKFEQNPALRARLLATGDAPLVEASPRDSYWGAGADGKGQNRLGMILEIVRANLRQRKVE